MSLSDNFTSDIVWRSRVVAVLIGLFFALLVWRLIDLQFVQGDRYRAFASSHGVRSKRLLPERGEILDRNGEVLVGSQRSHDLVVIPQYLGDLDETVATLAALTTLEPEGLYKQLAKRTRQPAYLPLTIQENATLDDVGPVLTTQSPWMTAALRGVEVAPRFARHYADGALAPHLFGYLREINEEILQEKRQAYPGRYFRGDHLGATGLEALWDLQLRGRDGFEEQLVDARGYEISSTSAEHYLQWRLPTTGSTLHVTIDRRVQEAARDAMLGKRGAVVAIEPATGAVLALVSSPGYDLSRLASRDRSMYWPQLQFHPMRPMFHRAIAGAYPPGSTYKMVVAAAALEEKLVTPEERMHCRGGLHMGGRTFGCWRRSGHGSVNLHQALVQSCDVYFYHMGRRLGPDRLAAYAAKFGLGVKTGIGLPHERSGLIPTTAWKEQYRGQPWNPGETLSIAIGQGYDLVTPLQAAVMVATVANGGFRVEPYVVERVDDRMVHTSGLQERVLSADVVAAIQQGLIGVVNEAGGTAGRLRALNLKIAGKTGTAQVVSLDLAAGLEAHKDHAWFVAYAPYDNPQIAVAVVVEHGGHGGATAAPVAGEVIKAYTPKPKASSVVRIPLKPLSYSDGNWEPIFDTGGGIRNTEDGRQVLTNDGRRNTEH